MTFFHENNSSIYEYHYNAYLHFSGSEFNTGNYCAIYLFSCNRNSFAQILIIKVNALQKI